MDLSELKKELHASIEETNDEHVLLEITQILSANGNFDYEQTEEFQNAINKARTSILDGKGVSDDEARQLINAKFSTSK